MKQKDSFIVYRSFFEATKPLKDEDRLALLDAIFEFGLNHDVTELEPLPKAMFGLIKPQLEANHKRWLAGNKGGRPRTSEEVREPKGKPKDNQEITETKPKDNLEITKDEPNKNDNDNVNDNDNKNVVVCTEQQVASIPNEVFQLPLNDKSDYSVVEDDFESWRELYPGVDVLQELRKMKGWLDSNPKRKKTSRGISNFITNWLSKEQDRGPKIVHSRRNSSSPGLERLKELAQ